MTTDMWISCALNFSKIDLRSPAARSLEYARTTISFTEPAIAFFARAFSKKSNRRTSRVVDSADFVNTRALVTWWACTRWKNISGFCDGSQTIMRSCTTDEMNSM